MPSSADSREAAMAMRSRSSEVNDGPPRFLVAHQRAGHFRRLYIGGPIGGRLAHQSLERLGVAADIRPGSHLDCRRLENRHVASSVLFAVFQQSVETALLVKRIKVVAAAHMHVCRRISAGTSSGRWPAGSSLAEVQAKSSHHARCIRHPCRRAAASQPCNSRTSCAYKS